MGVKAGVRRGITVRLLLGVLPAGGDTLWRAGAKDRLPRCLAGSPFFNAIIVPKRLYCGYCRRKSYLELLLLENQVWVQLVKVAAAL